MAAYAACATYRDEGIVTTTYFNPGRRTEQRPFSTRFVRPDGFLFEFRSRCGEDDWDQYAVWKDNGRARRWSSQDAHLAELLQRVQAVYPAKNPLMPVREEPSSLSLAIAGATGVSGGSAYRVPRLLMPELNQGPPPEGWPPANILDVPEAAAQDCIVLERLFRFGGVEQVWVDRHMLLVRRVIQPRHGLYPPLTDEMERLEAADPARREQRIRMSSVEVETITTYEAAFDAKIEPDELVFVPPAA
jgi:hypothetical protein